MGIDIQKPARLYKVYSYVNNYKKLGEVCLEWVYHMRESPIAPYHRMVRDYELLTTRDQERARSLVDQMFTDSEVETLCRHLEKEHNIESFLIEKPLPITVADREDARAAPKDIWETAKTIRFSEESGCGLPFEVFAHCRVRRNLVRNDKDLLRLIKRGRERIDVMTEKVFAGLPGLVAGIHCYILDCGCVALRQKFEDGSLNNEVEVHHDPDRGPCEVCSSGTASWENRVIDEVTVYNTKIQIA